MSLPWWPVATELLASEEFRRLPAAAGFTWLRLMNLCAARRGGGRLVGLAAWTRSDYQHGLGADSSAKHVAELVDRGIAAWDGADLVLRDYPIEAEARAEAKRSAGAAGAANRWKKVGTEVDATSRRQSPPPPPPETTSAESHEIADGRPIGDPMRVPMQRKSKRERKSSSGSSLRESPAAGAAEAKGGQQLGLLPDQPAPPKPPKAPPPWRRMLDAFAKGAGSHWVEGAFDPRLAIPLGQVAKLLAGTEPPTTARDLEEAGRWVRANYPSPVDPSWAAKAGKLAGALARAKAAGRSDDGDEGWSRPAPRAAPALALVPAPGTR